MTSTLPLCHHNYEIGELVRNSTICFKNNRSTEHMHRFVSACVRLFWWRTMLNAGLQRWPAVTCWGAEGGGGRREKEEKKRLNIVSSLLQFLWVIIIFCSSCHYNFLVTQMAKKCFRNRDDSQQTNNRRTDKTLARNLINNSSLIHIICARLIAFKWTAVLESARTNTYFLIATQWPK